MNNATDIVNDIQTGIIESLIDQDEVRFETECDSLSSYLSRILIHRDLPQIIKVIGSIRHLIDYMNETGRKEYIPRLEAIRGVAMTAVHHIKQEESHDGPVQ
jgi:hypothetical protein